MQLHRVQPHLHAVTIDACRNLAIGGEQRQLAVPLTAFIKGFDQLAPGIALAVIDLAEIQHLPLDHLATGATPVLDDIPVSMLFAVFEASVESQEHDANHPTPTGTIGKRYLVYTTGVLPSRSIDSIRICGPVPRKNRRSRTPVGKVGLAKTASDPIAYQRYREHDRALGKARKEMDQL
jgi:hypothetical protein